MVLVEMSRQAKISRASESRDINSLCYHTEGKARDSLAALIAQLIMTLALGTREAQARLKASAMPLMGEDILALATTNLAYQPELLARRACPMQVR